MNEQLCFQWNRGHVTPWWDESYKELNYEYFPYPNKSDLDRWTKQGYHGVNLNGAAYKGNMPRPAWADPFLTLFPWKNIGLTFYKMKTLDMIPMHQDHFMTYKVNCNITDPTTIWRAVVFMDDWKSGHYIEIAGTPLVNWKKGDWISWNYDVPHFAGNFGIDDRYTLQITGTLDVQN